MRAIKTTTISILALGLLAGSAVGVAAQDEVTTAAVEGTFSVGECTEAGDWSECTFVIEASDERLSGDGFLRNAGAVFQGFDFGGEGVIVIANSSVRVEDADGAWSGGGPLFALPTSEAGALGTDQPTWVLTGEGGYDGLTALLRADLGPEADFGGVIFEGDLQAAPPLE